MLSADHLELLLEKVFVVGAFGWTETLECLILVGVASVGIEGLQDVDVGVQGCVGVANQSILTAVRILGANVSHSRWKLSLNGLGVHKLHGVCHSSTDSSSTIGCFLQLIVQEALRLVRIVIGLDMEGVGNSLERLCLVVDRQSSIPAGPFHLDLLGLDSLPLVGCLVHALLPSIHVLLVPAGGSQVVGQPFHQVDLHKIVHSNPIILL